MSPLDIRNVTFENIVLYLEQPFLFFCFAHKLLEDRDYVLLLLVPIKVPAICVAQIQQALVY